MNDMDYQELVISDGVVELRTEDAGDRLLYLSLGYNEEEMGVGRDGEIFLTREQVLELLSFLEQWALDTGS